MATTPERRDRIQEQADRLAELLGVDPEDVMFDAHGVSLSVGQADRVIALLETSGGASHHG